MSKSSLSQRPVCVAPPEGFAELDGVAKQQAMVQARCDPKARPDDLQGMAWDILDTVTTTGALDNPELLPESRRVLTAITDPLEAEAGFFWKSVNPSPKHNRYLDAKIAINTYECFESILHDKPVSEETRAEMVRRTGGLIHKIAAHSGYRIDKINRYVGVKLMQVLSIGILATNDAQQSALLIPAIPTMHYFRGFNKATQTTAFSLRLLQPGIPPIPTAVTRFVAPEMYEEDRHYGVLQLPLGPILASVCHGGLRAESTRAIYGGTGLLEERRQRWLADDTLRSFAEAATTGEPIVGERRKIIAYAGRKIIAHAARYDPAGVNLLRSWEEW